MVQVKFVLLKSWSGILNNAIFLNDYKEMKVGHPLLN